ncbi:hypothetical protein L6164_030240 [Bauhinia variegata]|uniref:Uncharacterized protein n=1 Tax=Bauhinia variegata TaxID=167791 RepID=A0ACB9LBT2_BAUVA|nr:hypothetical protein L6164_030240 [Bauhinia variegata]
MKRVLFKFPMNPKLQILDGKQEEVYIPSFQIHFLDAQTKTPASFETIFFQFSKSPISEQNSHGNGLPIIIVPDEFTVGRPGPWLAMLNDACEHSYKALAIEFGTRTNPEFGDSNDNHMGINLGNHCYQHGSPPQSDSYPRVVSRQPCWSVTSFPNGKPG